MKKENVKSGDEPRFIIAKGQLENLINYLATKPYNEIFVLIDQLRHLPQLLDSGKTADEPAKLFKENGDEEDGTK